jgi:Tfp pilus assembly protein PilW
VRTAGSAQRSVRGVTLVELVVGMGITLLVLGACVGALAASARLVATLGARAEVEDTAQLAAEAFRFDARRAGFDPTAAGVERLAAALPDQLTLQADLDADGTLDAGSEEVTRWLCATAPPRLSRIIGAQSLPVAAPVSRCGMRYFDASGSELLPGAGGLDTAERARVRRVVLDFAVDPASAGAAASRIVEVALRVTS